MKKTKAYSLESDVIQVIEDYKKKYDLSSASAALERILLVELPKRVALDEIKELLTNVSVVKKDEIKEVQEDIEINSNNEELQNTFLKNSFLNNRDNMPE